MKIKPRIIPLILNPQRSRSEASAYDTGFHTITCFLWHLSVWKLTYGLQQLEKRSLFILDPQRSRSQCSKNRNRFLHLDLLSPICLKTYTRTTNRMKDGPYPIWGRTIKGQGFNIRKRLVLVPTILFIIFSLIPYLSFKLLPKYNRMRGILITPVIALVFPHYF